MTRRSLLRPLFFLALAAAAGTAACNWDPSRPFDREAPLVNEALREYDAGDAGGATELLQTYLATGGCEEGNIGTPPRLRERPNGSFDLGLALFKLAEMYGHRFGDEENDAGFLDPNLGKIRGANVDCALRVVRAIAEDPTQPLPLRARARYLEGNLLFLTAAYKEAVTAYEKALELVPGMPDAEAGAVDTVGRDAAWNRAVALRRIEDKKDAGNDAAPPDGGQGDGGSSDNKDGGSQDKNSDGGQDDKSKDGGTGKDDKKDAGKDAGQDDKDKDKNKDKNDGADAAPPPPPPPSRQSQDERILDQLENAPTVQQEAARKQRGKRPVKGTADK